MPTQAIAGAQPRKREQAMPRMNVKEAAEYCRCHPATLNKLRSKRQGPAWSKPFGRVLYEQADLDAWIAASRRDPGASPWEQAGISRRTWYRQQRKQA